MRSAPSDWISASLVLVAVLTLSCCSGSSGGSGGGTGSRVPLRRLSWDVQPVSLVRENRQLPLVELSVRDAQTGEIDAGADFSVEISLVANSTGAALSGSTSVEVENGRARFAGLAIDKAGSGYRLEAVVPSRSDIEAARSEAFGIRFDPRHAIVMIADGWGYPHIAATRAYTKVDAPYADSARFESYAMSTFSQTTLNRDPAGYDPKRAWSSLDYLRQAPTGSASSATAIFTGVKTDNGRVSATPDGASRLRTLAELAAARGYGRGTATTVPISHATTAAFAAHNKGRFHGFALADELLWGNPNTTGNASQNISWSGGLGPTLPVIDVVLGGGHPDWFPAAINPYVSRCIWRGCGSSRGGPPRGSFSSACAGVRTRARGSSRLRARRPSSA